MALSQNCPGNKVQIYKGGVKCGCHCKKKCVSPEDLPLYLNEGWNQWGCFTCCWVSNDEEYDIHVTALTAVVPNEKDGSLSVSFTLEKESEVTLQLIDITGRKVATVANAIFSDTDNELIWDENELNPGIYYLTMHAGDYNETKMVSVVN